MRNLITILGVLVASAGACSHQQEATLETPQVASFSQTVSTPTIQSPTSAPASKKLFLDVHELGPGKVTAAAVAGAHQKDLAVQGKYGVDLKAYWLDEKAGKIFCLAEAPSAEALNRPCTARRTACWRAKSWKLLPTTINGSPRRA